MKRMNRNMELADFTAKLAMFIRKGIPIDETIKNIRSDLADRDLKDSFDRVASACSHGDSFWVALESAPKIYPSYLKTVIQMGEENGRLVETLEDISSYLRDRTRLEEMAGNAFRGFLVPFNFILLFAAFSFMLITPWFLDLYDGMNLSLPFPTKTALLLTSLFSNKIFIGIYFLFILAVNFLFLVGSPVRNLILFNLTLTGSLLKKYYAFVVSRLSSMILKQGGTIEFSLNEIEKGMDFSPVKQTLHNLRKKLENGNDIRSIIGKCSDFPQSFKWMLKEVKNPEDIQDLMNTSANFYKMDIEIFQFKSMKIVNGLYILVVGGILLVSVFSMFLPMYQLIGKLY